MRYFRYCVICLTIIFISSAGVYGQIIGEGAVKDTVTAYSTLDTIFVFNQYPSAKPGNLLMKSPTGDTVTFQWYQFDTITYLFDLPVKPISTYPNSLSSNPDSLAQGGYRVKIFSSGTLIDSVTAWVFLNNYSLSLNKDVQSNLLSIYKHCYFIDLIVYPVFSNFIYYNPSDSLHKKLTLRNHLTCLWTANPVLTTPLIIDTATTQISNNIITTDLRIGAGASKDGITYRNGKPPAEPTQFTVQATDKFQLTKLDTLNYAKPILSTWSHFNKSYKEFNDTTSAPLFVTFTDSSQNATLYHWSFGDGTTDTSSKQTQQHIYYLPKKDTIMLVTTAPNLFCVDTSFVTVQIARAYLGSDTTRGSSGPSQISNYFFAGKENFKVALVSVKEFQINIYSRWGTQVYEHHGYSLYDWEGWDGNVGLGQAAQGIYFYVIKVLTWDPNPIPDYIHTDGIYKNFFYLFRSY